MDSILSNEKELTDLASLFQIKGKCINIKVITAGNINATYRLDYDDEGEVKSYILQKVNTYVFKSPEQIMSNISLVTSHILAKDDCNQKTLVFHNTKDGRNYYDDGDGNFWRICDNIDSISLDSCDDYNVLEAVGVAFGDFQNALADFDASKLFETIHDFHNTKSRIENLLKDIDEDPCNRVSEVADEINFVRENMELACRLTNMLEAGELPLRVTHNDTKFNNVLFDKVTKYPIAIIDLDTVMPGLAMHDFGDAVRFACSTAAEDEKNTDIVSIDVDKFTAFSKGFISKTCKSLTENEINTMVLGAITITIELGVRFLDDYITGDKYFKTVYEGHNLIRTRCQFALAKDMIAKRAMLESIVKNICK